MYSIENSLMGSKVGVAAMLGPANLHILCDFIKFVGFQRNLVGVNYNFEVIGGQIMRIFSNLSDFNEIWWMSTTFGPDRSGGCSEVS